jgi:ABC-2 type transport system ATP-binding protein
MSVHAPVLTVCDLAHAYPGRRLFDGYSAAYPPGLNWLRGPNGAGKSTLMKLLAGALPLQAVSVELRGLSLLGQPLANRREVFWCGSDALPFDHLLPPEYWAFMAGLYPRFDRSGVPAHLQGLGLDTHLSTPMGGLSTGTRRKVWLCAALAADTAVVLLDEPFNALDDPSAAYLRQVLAQVAAEASRCWIVASHEAPLTPPFTPSVHATEWHLA